MNIDGATYIFLIVVSSLLFHAFGRMAWRKGVLLGASAAFTASFATNPVYLVPLAGYGLAVVGGIYLVAWRSVRVSFWMVTVGVVGAFLLLRGYVPVDMFQRHPIVTIGVSYMLFRAIQLLVDISDGAVDRKDLDPLDLLLFLFSFLTLSAGPIQRFDDFKKQLSELHTVRLRGMEWPPLVSRMALGYFKIVVAGPFLLGLHNKYVMDSGGAASYLAIAAVAFLAYVYINFSGYMDVTISVGRLFGFRLPENFDSPHNADNFLDLWNRWHITLSSTFKAYVFYPLVRLLMMSPLFRRVPALAGVIGYFLVFFLMGLWHGNTAPFIVFGLFLGAGVASNKLWEQLRLLWGDPLKRTMFKHGALQQVSASLASASAIAYFTLATVAAWPSVTSIAGLVSIYSHQMNAIKAFFILTVCIAAFKLSCAVLSGLHGRVVRVPFPSLYSRWGEPVAAGLAFVTTVSVKLMSDIEFSTLIFYQRF